MSIQKLAAQQLPQLRAHKSLKKGDAAKNGPVDRLERGRPNGAVKSPHRVHGNKYAHFSKAAQVQSEAAHMHMAGAAGALGSIAASNLFYPNGKWNLVALADQALTERGLATDFPADVQAQVAAIEGPAAVPVDATWSKDMRDKPWTSIDNPTSQDLDQLAFCERLPNGDIKMYVAVTNVRSLVPLGSPLDKFMDVNTTSIYTADKTYPLMPEKLSCDLISLNPGQDRFANILEYTICADGSTKDENCYQGLVNNHAKMNYPDINKWIAGGSVEGAPIQGLDAETAGNHGVYDQLRMQNEASQRLQAYRDASGSLHFESTEVRMQCKDGVPVGWEKHELGPANKIVENQMVTANQVMSRFLRAHGYPTLERIVERPEKWDQIVNFAADRGYSLPAAPDGLALQGFLDQQKQLEPKNFENVSGQVVRMVGRGKYVHVTSDDVPPGHFGMGIDNYVQSTAQMRRRGDQINGDIFEAALRGKPCPYSPAQLDDLAQNLTEKEETAKKAERQADKAAMAVYLGDHLGEQYDARISGMKDGQVWVRVSNPPFEAPLPGVHSGAIGKHQRVKLDSVDPQRGWINIKKA